MPLILPGNVGSATASTAHNVSHALRFEPGDNDHLERDPSSSGNRQKFTISFWMKISEVATTTRNIIGCNTAGNDYFIIRMEDSEVQLLAYNTGSLVMSFGTNALLRDPNAWYHLVFAVDTTQGTEGNRFKLYLNGSQVTSLRFSNYPSENATTLWNHTENHFIGCFTEGVHNFPGYLCEIVNIDGSQLDASSFGEFDSASGIWKPKDPSDLTFGTNGFYLNIPGASTGQNSSGMGGDSSGNGHHFGSSGLAADSRVTDTCTNNYAIINALDNNYNPATLSQGNLKVTTATSGGYPPTVSSFGVSSGKWYAECKYVSRSHSDNYALIGVKSTQITNTNYFGTNANDYAYYSGNGKYYQSNSGTNYGNSFDQGDTIGIYLDLDNNKLYFSKDGTLQNSGTGISITAPASTSLGNYFFSAGDYGNSVSVVFEWNFGGGTPTSISSGNTDGEYGNFEYSTTITGDGVSKTFKALNTKNLAEFG
tara:strand:- start:12 stop:1451 length:1440 start_codon:yes stop_codon:yes gene_type:complete